MAMIIRSLRPVLQISRLQSLNCVVAYSNKGSDTKAPAARPPTATTVKPPDPPKPVAVDRNDQYQVKEYFSYNEFSYYDIDSAMCKHRLPQPNPNVKSL
ncbi:uncharacterized protein LOC100375956 [Saccoglossus kowalevskii]